MKKKSLMKLSLKKTTLNNLSTNQLRGGDITYTYYQTFRIEVCPYGLAPTIQINCTNNGPCLMSNPLVCVQIYSVNCPEAVQTIAIDCFIGPAPTIIGFNC
jgi:hypothetical protein